MDVEKEETTTSSSPNYDQSSHVTRLAQVATRDENQDASASRGGAWVWYIIGILDALLVLRLLFHLFGAKTVGFASFLYSLTGPFVAPFKGIFASPSSQGSYFDTAAIAAIVVYILIGWGVAKLIDLAVRPKSSNQV